MISRKLFHHVIPILFYDYYVWSIIIFQVVSSAKRTQLEINCTLETEDNDRFLACSSHDYLRMPLRRPIFLYSDLVYIMWLSPLSFPTIFFLPHTFRNWWILWKNKLNFKINGSSTHSLYFFRLFLGECIISVR